MAAEVLGVPPDLRALAVLGLLESGVAVRELGEGEVEVRPERVVEVGRSGAEGVDLGVGRVAERDVDAGPPDGDVVAEQSVRSVAVAERDRRAGDAGGGVGQAGQLGQVGGGNPRRDRRGVVSGRPLLD